MARREREPQSDGSGRDWSRGTTGQRVNDPKASPPPAHEELYDERREAEGSDPFRGGLNSPVQLAENDPAGGRTTDESLPQQKVTLRYGGAKRDSYFRRRDYE